MWVVCLTILCDHPYLVSLPFAVLLSLQLAIFYYLYGIAIGIIHQCEQLLILNLVFLCTFQLPIYILNFHCIHFQDVVVAVLTLKCQRSLTKEHLSGTVTNEVMITYTTSYEKFVYCITSGFMRAPVNSMLIAHSRENFYFLWIDIACVWITSKS